MGSGKSGRAKTRDTKIGDRRQEPVSPHFHEKEILVFLPLSSHPLPLVHLVVVSEANVSKSLSILHVPLTTDLKSTLPTASGPPRSSGD